MTDDLVKRLRERSRQYVDNEYNFDKQAADRIEKLEDDIGVLIAASIRLSSRIDVDLDPYVDRIEKLEAALREIAQTVTIEDESWHPSYHDPRFTQKQAEGLAEALSARIKISRKALEGKDD